MLITLPAILNGTGSSFNISISLGGFLFVSTIETFLPLVPSFSLANYKFNKNSKILILTLLDDGVLISVLDPVKMVLLDDRLFVLSLFKIP